MSHMNPDAGAYLPTRKQIKAMCLEFQANWTPAERERRKVYKHNASAGWSLPESAPIVRLGFLYEESDCQVLNNYLPLSGDLR